MTEMIETIERRRDQLLKVINKADQKSARRIIDAANTKIAKIKMTQIDKENLPELEEENFRVDSDGWEIYKRGSPFFQGLPFCDDYEEYSLNPRGDIVKLISTEYKGEQFFTWDAAMRETAKAGKIIPSYQEWELMGDISDLIIFAGEYYLDTCRGVGYLGVLHGQGRTGCYWTRSSINGGIRAWGLHVDHHETYQGLYKYEKNCGRSVRCFK